MTMIQTAGPTPQLQAPRPNAPLPRPTSGPTDSFTPSSTPDFVPPNAAQVRAASQSSPADRIQGSYDRANQSWNTLNEAFSQLPETDKKELGARVGQQLKQWQEANKDKNITPDQLNEMKWMTQATVSADWAQEQAQKFLSGKTHGMTAQHASVIQALGESGQSYAVNRNEYLQAGGAVGQ